MQYSRIIVVASRKQRAFAIPIPRALARACRTCGWPVHAESDCCARTIKCPEPASARFAVRAASLNREAFPSCPRILLELLHYGTPCATEPYVSLT